MIQRKPTHQAIFCSLLFLFSLMLALLSRPALAETPSVGANDFYVTLINKTGEPIDLLLLDGAKTITPDGISVEVKEEFRTESPVKTHQLIVGVSIEDKSNPDNFTRFKFNLDKNFCGSRRASNVNIDMQKLPRSSSIFAIQAVGAHLCDKNGTPLVTLTVTKILTPDSTKK